MKNLFFVLLCFFLTVACFGQTGELDRFDCTYSKEIIIPFNYSETNPSVKPQLNQVVFYSYRDQFTYWYKIVSKTNETLHFKASAINDSDSYVVYVYQYNKPDFCNKLYSQNIKPIATPFYIGYGSEQSGQEQKILTVQKDNVYYISVLNTSLNNCGHYFNLNYGTDTLKVKALHLPCKKDVTTIPVIPKVVKPVIKPKTDSVIVPKPPVVDVKGNDTPKLDSVIVPKPQPVIAEVKEPVEIPVSTPALISNTVNYIVKDKKKSTAMNSNITVVDTDSKERVELVNKGTGVWEATLEKDKKYKLKSTAFGYTDLEIHTDISKGNVIELLMEPLKVGDNFIMRSIYFHPNTYALRRESAGELQTLLNYMINNPSVSIEIQGHTNGDNRIYKNKAYENLGEEWNFKGSSKDLSLKRSEAIKKYLVTNGISEERLLPKGYGGSKPIIEVPETMEEGQRNIRVEVVILKD